MDNTMKGGFLIMDLLLKNEKALEVLTTVSLAEFLVLTVVLVSAAIALFRCKDKIKHFLETYRETENKKEAVLNQIDNNEKEIERIKSEYQHDKQELYDQQWSYRQQSLQKQEQIDCQFVDLIDRLDSLTLLLERQHQETQEIKRNELREQLLKSYRYYTSKEKNPSQTWNEMEAEAFWHTYGDYEKLGGNGYMAAVVKPAMKLLTVVPI